PASIVILIDQGAGAPADPNADPPRPTAKVLDDGLSVPFDCNNASNPFLCFIVDYPSFVHSGGATFTFADGHAKWFKADQFYNKNVSPDVVNMFDWRLPH